MKTDPRKMFRPPFLAIGALVVAWGVDRMFPTSPIAALPARLGAAIAFLTAGGVLAAWTVRLFDRAGTTHKPWEKPSGLVREGPYRHSRNPMYVGVALFLLGIGALVGTVPFLLVPVVWLVVVDRFFVRFEERLLADLCGEAYWQYKRRVRRWI